MIRRAVTRLVKTQKKNEKISGFPKKIYSPGPTVSLGRGIMHSSTEVTFRRPPCARPGKVCSMRAAGTPHDYRRPHLQPACVGFTL